MDDFRDIITTQKEGKEKEAWEGNLLDYLYLVKEKPDIATFAPGRLYEIIQSKGTDEVDPSFKTRGYDDLVSYNFFKDKIYGSFESIHDLMKLLKASARRTETGKRILILVGPVGSGKCLSGNTKIYNVDDGKFYAIKDIVKNEMSIKVQSYDENGIPEVKLISSFFNNGTKPLYRLTLDNGSSVECTSNHEFLTPGNKWITLEDLNIDDYVVSTRELLSPNNTVDINEEEVKLYAYYMAEGNNSAKGNSIGFSNVDPVVIMDFYECAKKIEPNCTLKNYDKEGRTWNPTCERGVGNKIKDFVKEWGLYGKLSIEKNINERIFQLSNEKISLFLGTIWSCDGYINKNGFPSYSTSSKEFSEGVRDLLLRIGIQSHTVIKKTERHDTYPVSIYGYSNLEKFYYLISPYIKGSGKKLDRLDSIIQTRRQNSSDIIPSSYIYPILKEEYEKHNIKIKRRGNRDYKHRIDYYLEQNIGREKLRELGEFSCSEKLINISDSDFYYRKIKNIEFIGNGEVFDIEVPKNHNFVISGGIITHNSTLASLLKRGLEDNTAPIYGIKGCPIHEEPLHVIPLEDRPYWEEKLGVKIEGIPCPMCQKMIDDEYTKNGVVSWEDIPVERVFLSEQKRIGIGTFAPSDPKAQDVSELIGRPNMAKLSRYGETDPRAFDFSGELQVANRGMIELIELLKVDIKLQYVLISLAQEQVIKSPGFPQMYIDTLIVAHSVVGETPIPYKKNGVIRFDTIEKLTDIGDTDIEVISMNLNTKTPEWTKVKSFCKHPFTGKLIKTIQKKGYVDTTYNHSIYSTDYECFYPEEKKDILTVDIIPYTKENKEFTLETSDDMIIDEKGYARIADIENYQGNGSLRKSLVKVKYSVDESESYDILKILAWYISEGHIFVKTKNHRSYGICISQQNTEELEILAESAKRISTNKPYTQYRQNEKDGTSRLSLSSILWYKIVDINCGRYSLNKRIPNFVFNLPTNMKEFFINELVKGDGHINGREMEVENDILHKHFSYKTISKMLASQFCFLLSQLGIKYSVYRSKTDSGHESFDIKTINNHNNVYINKTEDSDVVDTMVYDIECIGNHSFVGGIGNVVCHNTNETEYDSFRSDKKNEALHDRMYPIFVPWNLRVDDEIKIYEKMIRESDFRNIHIAPNTLKIAAEFAVLSRLKPSKKVSSLVEKMKIYNGEVSEEFRKTEIDVKTLRQEGREQGEGMTGISPRFIINALNIALGAKEDKKCINPIDVIRALRSNFDHQIGISDEDKQTFINLLIADKDSVNSEFREIAKKEVNMAFIYAYEEQADALFKRYMENVGAFCKKEKVTDNITGEMSDPDEKLMRSLEELIGVPVNSKSEFRNNIFVYKADKLEDGKSFNYTDYDPLRDAIEKKLMSDLKNVVSLSISDTTSTDPKAAKRREKAMEILLNKGYCESCASVLLAFVGEILRKSQ